MTLSQLEHSFNNAPPADFDAIAFINEPRWREMSLGLDRVKMLMRILGDPQDRTPCVHVAGTNGKGSFCAYLESILRESGYKTGMFTSPYIERFEERIRVNGKMIPNDDLTAIAWRVKEAAEAVQDDCGEHPTEFELMFACAAVYFVEQDCDIVVYECGLGGRLDATNCVSPEVCVITPIGLDHIDVLGNTIEEIAGEKAGIIKHRVPVLSAPQEPEVLGVLRSRCKLMDCSFHVLDYSSIVSCGIDPKTMEQSFCHDGVEYKTSLLGSYQPLNASLALDAAQLLMARGFRRIDGSSMQAGIAKAHWPGRFEVIKDSELPTIVIDGAHNADGARAFKDSLASLLCAAGKKWDDVIAVCGVLGDKDFDAIVGALAGQICNWIVYEPPNGRALAADRLAEVVEDHGASATVAPDAMSAMGIAVEKAGPEGVVAAFGSLYGISSIKLGLSQIASGANTF